MDKFQTELLAQLKEHNRLTKELVKIEQANFELSKNINDINSSLADAIILQNQHTDTLGTYCGVYPEIFSAVKVRPAHWISHKEHCENLGVMPSGLGSYVWCSNCDCGIDITEWHRNPYNYCPNCGMEMEKEGEDNEISN